MNKGIYQAVPVIWGLPPGSLIETKCFFNGDDYCEYHLQWETPNRIKYFCSMISRHWRVFQDSTEEIERDKEILRGKYEQVYRLNQDLQQKVNQLTTLQESSTAVLSTLKLKELLDLILKRLLKVAYLDRAGIFLLDKDSNKLRLIHAVGIEAAILSDLKDYQVPLNKADNIIARTARGKKSILVEDVDKMFLNPQNPILQRLKPKAFILVPIAIRDQVIGIMVGDNHKNRTFIREIDRNFLASFANHIAMALENANLYKKLEDSERKYREIVENVNEGIWVLDEEGTIKFSNQYLGEMLGYRDLIDHNVYSLVDRSERKTLLRVIMKNMEEKVAKEEIVLQGKGGNAVSVLLSSVPIVTGDHEYSGSLAMLTDLTEKKCLEGKLLQAQKLESIGTMAGGIAHDFNNILTGILGYTMLLKQKVDPGSEIGHYTDIIERSGLKAADLVKRLLAFSRNSYPGKSRILSSINKLIEETLELLKSSLPKNIELESSLEKDIPLVKCDPTQFQQIILNICLNARDAMPDGGHLMVATKETEYKEIRATHPGLQVNPGRYICISLSDTGMGISPEVRDRIFDPFFTTKEVGKGTGLGLAMVYGILKAIGGHVDVKSEVGQGTTFDLFFPVAESIEGQAGGPQAANAQRGSETILVVDDEEVVRELASEILSEYGYRVMLAKDGAEAIHIYRAFEHNIDLVIMDMVMPKMTGEQAYMKLKKIDPEVKILLSSGYGSSNQELKKMRRDGVLFINKPYKIKELLSKVRQVLDSEPSRYCP
ncbi:MAG: response regulator [Nitrospiraceae bacterium]|nr:response regulator [Nitrospiraceae bacterium]